jgi:hypothetical protein
MKPTLTKRPKTFSFEIRDAESFGYSITISKPFGSLDSVIDWAKHELTEEWRWQVIRTSSDQAPGSYVFYFDSESDYVAFTMKFA